jgi:hypothetical protein
MDQEALKVAQRKADAWPQRDAWHLLGDCALMRGDPVSAARRYREALALGRALRHPLLMVIDLQGVAMALAGQGQARRAICLDAIASKELRSFGPDPEAFPFWKRLLDQYVRAARAWLGADVTSAVEEGQTLRLDGGGAGAGRAGALKSRTSVAILGVAARSHPNRRKG